MYSMSRNFCLSAYTIFHSSAKRFRFFWSTSREKTGGRWERRKRTWQCNLDLWKLNVIISFADKRLNVIPAGEAEINFWTRCIFYLSCILFIWWYNVLKSRKRQFWLKSLRCLRIIFTDKIAIRPSVVGWLVGRSVGMLVCQS